MVRHNAPGRIRRKLAEMIAKALTEAGMDVSVQPENLRPNTGYWRTDLRADVMPWIGYFELIVQGERAKMTVASWATMTDLLKGFTFSRDGGEIELHALHERPAPRSHRLGGA